MKKQISMEDMAELICSYYCDKGYCPCDCKNCDNHKFAEEIIKGYRKISENAVVLTREEYERLKQCEEKIKSGVCFTQKEWLDFCNEDSNRRTCLRIEEREKARKETAREILQIIKREYDYIGDLERIIAKQYNVEIGEEV